MTTAICPAPPRPLPPADRATTVRGAISIRPLWAWLIAGGYKTWENRTRALGPPGLYYVHAGKVINLTEYRQAVELFERLRPEASWLAPGPLEIKAGGIVGVMRLGAWRSVRDWRNPWCTGPGHPVEWAAPLPFTPCHGQLGVWQPKVSVPGLDRALRMEVAS